MLRGMAAQNTALLGLLALGAAALVLRKRKSEEEETIDGVFIQPTPEAASSGVNPIYVGTPPIKGGPPIVLDEQGIEITAQQSNGRRTSGAQRASSGNGVNTGNVPDPSLDPGPKPVFVIRQSKSKQSTTTPLLDTKL